jgi:DNA-binding response OmpR family regulator
MMDSNASGLAMVKQLAELHGGTVAVASVAGEGATFAAWLPLRAPSDAVIADAIPAVHASSSGQVASGGRTVLVVEDDDQAADLVRLMLETEGFGVVRAASAEAALTIMSGLNPSLITLDIQLPGLDGWEFLRRLREDSRVADVPVVIVAGVVDRVMALAGGAACILEKPISRTQLKTCLANLALLPAPEHTHTIMVVDDDREAVDMLASLLPSPHYAVLRAYGGREAIAMTQQVRPDLVLIDWMMPQTDAFDLVEALQHDVETAQTPILVVTPPPSETERDAGGVARERSIDALTPSEPNRLGFIAEVRRALHLP